MTLDRIIELALTASQEKDTAGRAVVLSRLVEKTSEKIPCLTGTIDREINLFDDFTLQDFFKIDFAGRDDEGRKYYRQDIRDINPMLYNFLVMDVLPLTGTIANSGGDRVRFGFCASLLYMALRNEQRRAQEERELFTIAGGKSENKPNATYSKELLSLFNNRVDLIESLHGSDDDIAEQIAVLSDTKDEKGKRVIMPYYNRQISAYARALKAAGIIELSERAFRDKLTRLNKQ